MSNKKIIEESLFEFERGKDPRASMGVGIAAKWNELKEEKKGRRIDDLVIKELGFNPIIIKRIDSDYYYDFIEYPLGGIRWILFFNYLNKSDKEELEKDTANSINNQKKKKQEWNNLNISQYMIEDKKQGWKNIKFNSLYELEKEMPIVAEAFKRNSLYFMDFNDYDPVGYELSSKYFDPANYSDREIFEYLNIVNIKNVLTIYPNYIERFNKYEGRINDKIELGSEYFPQLLEYLVETNYIPDSGMHWNNGLSLIHALDVKKQDPKITELLCVLIKRCKDNKDLSEDAIKELKKIAKRKLSSDIIKTYFSDLFPELSGSSEKLGVKDKDIIKKDYDEAIKLLVNSGKVAITSSPTQLKNGAIRFDIKGRPGLYYVINSSGYLRKQTTDADRLAVVQYDPFLTYTDLAIRALKSIDRDLKK